MPQQSINIGNTANDGTGDPLRTAFDKINDNFTELYGVTGAGAGQNLAISGNSLISEDTDGDITLDPNGTGQIVFAGHTNHNDNIKAYFGDSNDLEIYHDASSSYIGDQGAGGLYIGASAVNITDPTYTANLIVATPGGAVDLYYDNNKKFETDLGGVTVTGNINADGGTIAGNFSVTGGNTLAAGRLLIDTTTEINGNAISIFAADTNLDLEANGTGRINFVTTTQATVGGAGGASALPATPTGYAQFKVNGTSYVIPYYAVS